MSRWPPSEARANENLDSTNPSTQPRSKSPLSCTCPMNPPHGVIRSTRTQTSAVKSRSGSSARSGALATTMRSSRPGSSIRGGLGSFTSLGLPTKVNSLPTGDRMPAFCAHSGAKTQRPMRPVSWAHKLSAVERRTETPRRIKEAEFMAGKRSKRWKRQRVPRHSGNEGTKRPRDRC